MKFTKKKLALLSVVACAVFLLVVASFALKNTLSYFTSNKSLDMDTKVATVDFSLSPNNMATGTCLSSRVTHTFTLINHSNISTRVRVQVALSWDELLPDNSNISLGDDYTLLGDFFYLNHALIPAQNLDIVVNVNFSDTDNYIGQDYSIFLYVETIQDTKVAINEAWSSS